MSTLPEALLALRVAALMRIARKLGIVANSDDVFALAMVNADRDVIAELKSRGSRLGWLTGFLNRRSNAR